MTAKSWMWWLTSIISTVRTLKQDDHKLKACQGYTVGLTRLGGHSQ